MRRSVLDRLGTFRPLLEDSACSEVGRDRLICSSSSTFLGERIFPAASADEIQTFGSLGLGFSSPRAIAIVRALISETGITPIRSTRPGAVTLALRITLAIVHVPFLEDPVNLVPEVY